jgi:hypothetical protein
MIIKNNNVLELEAAQGERLTLSFDDPAGIATISYETPSGEGQLLPGTTHIVTVPAATTNHTPVVVSVVCVFKATGTCKVELTDETGHVAPHTFTSAFGMGADAVVYSIDVR